MDNVNVEIQKKISGYLDAIESSANQAGEFVIEQTPLFVQEYLAWYFWGSMFTTVVCSVIALILTVGSYKILKWSIDLEEGEKINVQVLTALISIGGLGIVIPIGIRNFYEMLKVCVAPRVVLVERLSELLQ